MFYSMVVYLERNDSLSKSFLITSDDVGSRFEFLSIKFSVLSIKGDISIIYEFKHLDI